MVLFSHVFNFTIHGHYSHEYLITQPNLGLTTTLNVWGMDVYGGIIIIPLQQFIRC
jgi:hypothetical protein